MNQRIQKLFLEAQKSVQFLANSEESKQRIVMERFAELIVGECVTRLEQHHPFTKDPEAYLYAISLIEEHFGVE